MARWGSVLGLVILVAYCVVAVLLSSTHLRKLSIADEAAHIDSVFLVPDVARTGQKMLPETLDELSCRGGVQGADFVPPPCGSYQPEPYEGYPIGGGGYNTADIHPPTWARDGLTWLFGFWALPLWYGGSGGVVGGTVFLGAPASD